ncbi:hypothetical protein DMJ13_25985 [halophilic archaeon]|nr:hypothetical protein DMJ13_25985 [halophilic archaeon]
MKDIADDYDLNHGDIYQVAARIVIALNPEEEPVLNPRPQDDDLAAVYDELLANCSKFVNHNNNSNNNNNNNNNN